MISENIENIEENKHNLPGENLSESEIQKESSVDSQYSGNEIKSGEQVTVETPAGSEAIPNESMEGTQQETGEEVKPFKKFQKPRGDTIYGDVRSLAVKVLTRVERTDAYLDKLIDFEVRNADFLNEYDKSLLNEISHGVMRWMRRLDWFLNGFYRGNWEKAVPEIKNAMRVALYQILYLNKIPDYAAVNEATEFVKRFSTQRHGDVVNGLLRTIIRTKETLVYPTREIDEVNYLGIMQSHPNWLIRRWIQRFGFDDAEKLAESNNKRPILTLRINNLRTTRDEVITKLNEKGIATRICRNLHYFITVRLMSKIYLDEDFQNGLYTVQDESAGLVSVLLAPNPGDIILDMCASPGGKTTHLSQLMRNNGKIIAVDKYDVKIKTLRANAVRLGCTNIEFIQDDAADFSSDIITTQRFDKILLDAPCSGLGVLSKKPEIRWKRELKDIVYLSGVQMNMLENAVKYLKPGGVIVYSTCTTEPEENLEVISKFLELHPEFKIDDASKYVNKELVNTEGCIETFPYKHNMDGSFAARLVKQV
jgi:16S rRNA (cytosine967-C5)-methyltransferase